jgi:ABC-type nickel/cobalt efflux system permease component RcnA
MLGIDEHLADVGNGGTLLLILAIALLLGLRHATDPDHLMAVSTLLASERDRTRARAASLGLAWGLGHATTLFAFGLPIVLFDDYLPGWFTSAAEVLIGVVIIALAVRLLMRWRRGYFHVHAHEHGDLVHVHAHVHERSAEHTRAAHEHRHPRPMRSRSGAYGIGLIHGVGGSAGVGILLLAAIPNRIEALAALLVFATFTAVSMTVGSMYLGSVLTGERARRRRGDIAPVLGVTGVIFGCWYALGAIAVVPYVF